MRGQELNTVGIMVGALVVVGASPWDGGGRAANARCRARRSWRGLWTDPLVEQSPLTLKTLDPIGFRLGEKVLEIGP